jgi:integrase
MKERNQRKLFQKYTSKKLIRGYFYINGKRLIRTVCTFEKAGLDDDGKLISKSKSARSKLDIFLGQEYSKKLISLENETTAKPSDINMIKDLFQTWIKVSEVDRAERTVKHHYVPTSNKYIEFVGNHDILDICLDKIDRFKIGLKETGVSATTINIKLKTLKTFLNWCVDREYVAKIPKFEMIKTVKKLPNVLSNSDLNRLNSRIDKLIKEGNDKRHQRFYNCHKRFLMIAIGTGCRLQEIFWLTWDKIDLKNSIIQIKSNVKFTVKEKKEKEKMLPGYVCEYLKNERNRFPDERYLFDDGRRNLIYSDPHALTVAFRRHFKELKIKGVKAVHGFRASFATNLKNELNTDNEIIKNLLGHSDIRVTEGYFSNIDKPQKETVDKLKSPFI